MRMKLLPIVCLLSVAAVAQPRQDEKSAEKAFRDSLTNQLLILRGFSADPEVDLQWAAQGLQQGEPSMRTFGAIEPVSVKLKHGRIEIKGTRETVLNDNNGTLEFSEGRPVLLVVDLSDADPTIVFPKLKDDLFYANLEEALAAVPQPYKGFVHLRQEHPAVMQPGHRRGRSGEATACPVGTLGLVRPKVLRTAEPEFSEEARREKFSGNVMMGLTVDTNGEATDLWLMRPAGHGLDEQAAKAVRQYRFDPATCNGEPIATPLAIEVNFHIL